MSEVDFLVKLRDAAAMVLDATQERLSKLGPAETTIDLTKIAWTNAEGSKGPYQKSEDVNNPEFQRVLKALGDHKGGSMTIAGYFVWKFTDGTKIGRKKAQS